MVCIFWGLQLLVNCLTVFIYRISEIDYTGMLKTAVE